MSILNWDKRVTLRVTGVQRHAAITMLPDEKWGNSGIYKMTFRLPDDHALRADTASLKYTDLLSLCKERTDHGRLNPAEAPNAMKTGKSACVVI
jgi:hypothetical protein